METASFNGLLKTILYAVAFYYVFKFLARLFLPVLVKKAVEKAGENFQQQRQAYEGYQNQHQSNADEITYQTPKSDKPRETKKVGEYVDYEEIE
jgi:Domain of unknown function (DUF4834)